MTDTQRLDWLLEPGHTVSAFQDGWRAYIFGKRVDGFQYPTKREAIDAALLAYLKQAPMMKEKGR